MSSLRILFVAEKPSIAQSLANAFAKRREEINTRRGSVPIHEVSGQFLGLPCLYRITAVIGHVYATDFPGEYQNRQTVDPLTLFSAPIVKKEANPKARICKHLKQCAKGFHLLVLWLDCDREGENINFEVMQNTLPFLTWDGLPTAQFHAAIAKHRGSNPMLEKNRRVYRARFSALTPSDLRAAMTRLSVPNENEARAVDARQELDLKVGVAFTRFQNGFFHRKYGNLNADCLSYGPCQTPTLNFTVQRHDEIVSFQPEPFYSLQVSVRDELMGRHIKLEWQRGRLFDRVVANFFREKLLKFNGRTIYPQKVSRRRAKKSRPLPLNTVELLKACSSRLGIGPQQAMHVAERLYISGFISYPRTESTAYAPSVNLNATLQMFTSSAQFGDHVQALFQTGNVKKPRKGFDAGDHPPITPTQAADAYAIMSLGGAESRVYELICRQFVASLSPDCVYEKLSATFQIGDDEVFKARGTHLLTPGWTALVPNSTLKDEGLVLPENVGATGSSSSGGGAYTIQSVKIVEGETSPPSYLTESELISLMEKHGIGTDASIATHINTISTRNYAQVVGASRQIQPTEIGISLVHGYHRVDPDIVLPDVRAQIEKYIDLIATGKASHGQVVQHALDVFREKFRYFVANIEKMDELFEAHFSPITETAGKLFSKCGKCLHYMKIIRLKPVRLYCQTCDETYALPSNGSIKLYKELKCPLDGFELVLHTTGAKPPKSYPICPMCYNQPPFEFQKQGVGCNQCHHPTCRHSLSKLALFGCPDCLQDPMKQKEFKAEYKKKKKKTTNNNTTNEKTNNNETKNEKTDQAGSSTKSISAPSKPVISTESLPIQEPDDIEDIVLEPHLRGGVVVFDPNSKPFWRANCNRCNYVLQLPEGAHFIKPIVDRTCDICSCVIVHVEFNHKNNPLKSDLTHHSGCIFHDPILAKLCVETRTGRFRSQKYSRRGGRRGGRRKMNKEQRLMAHNG